MGNFRGSNRSFVRSTSSRRKTIWVEGPGAAAGTATAISSSSAAVLGSGFSVVNEAVTIVRMRGLLSVSLGLATSPQDGFWGAVGIGITTIQAFSDIGITALPHPIDEIDWEGWLWHSFYSLQSGVASSSSNPGPKDVLRIPVDSKAMRKLEDGNVVFAAHQAVEIGTSTAVMKFGTRMLLKLS